MLALWETEQVFKSLLEFFHKGKRVKSGSMNFLGTKICYPPPWVGEDERKGDNSPLAFGAQVLKDFLRSPGEYVLSS